jgi:hypothetical protein
MSNGYEGYCVEHWTAGPPDVCPICEGGRLRLALIALTNEVAAVPFPSDWTALTDALEQAKAALGEDY